jgi:hypothetical protein
VAGTLVTRGGGGKSKLFLGGRGSLILPILSLLTDGLGLYSLQLNYVNQGGQQEEEEEEEEEESFTRLSYRYDLV